MTTTATVTSSLALGWFGAVIAASVAVAGFVLAASRATAVTVGVGSPLAFQLAHAVPQYGPRVAAILGAQVLVGVIAGSLGPVLLRHVAMVTGGAVVAVFWIREVVAPVGEGGPSDLSWQASLLIGAMILVPLVVVSCSIGARIWKHRALDG